MRLALRNIHIFAGFATLIAACAALAFAKGSRAHRVAGRLFVVAGRVVIVTALVSCAWALVDIDSFVGAVSGDEADQVRATIQLLMGVLGVLSLLVAGDLEVGLAGIDPSRYSPVRPLRNVAAAAGLVVLVWGVASLTTGLGSIAWFAIVIGAIGFGDGVKERNRVLAPDPLVDHVMGMIGAAAGYLAAFLVFGGSRLMPMSLVDGDPLAAVPVLVAIAIGHLLTNYWSQRVRTRRIRDVSASELELR